MQGTKEIPENIDKIIDLVLKIGKEKIISMTEEDLAGYKKTLINQFKHKDETLLKRSSRIWREILLSLNDFNRKSNLIKEIEKITISDINLLFNKIFIQSPSKLSVQVFNSLNTKDLFKNT